MSSSGSLGGQSSRLDYLPPDVLRNAASSYLQTAKKELDEKRAIAKEARAEKKRKAEEKRASKAANKAASSKSGSEASKDGKPGEKKHRSGLAKRVMNWHIEKLDKLKELPKHKYTASFKCTPLRTGYIPPNEQAAPAPQPHKTSDEFKSFLEDLITGRVSTPAEGFVFDPTGALPPCDSTPIEPSAQSGHEDTETGDAEATPGVGSSSRPMLKRTAEDADDDTSEAFKPNPIRKKNKVQPFDPSELSAAFVPQWSIGRATQPNQAAESSAAAAAATTAQSGLESVEVSEQPARAVPVEDSPSVPEDGATSKRKAEEMAGADEEDSEANDEPAAKRPRHTDPEQQATTQANAQAEEQAGTESSTPAEGAEETPAAGAEETRAEGAEDTLVEGAKDTSAEGAEGTPVEGPKEAPTEKAQAERAKETPNDGAKEILTEGANETPGTSAPSTKPGGPEGPKEHEIPKPKYRRVSDIQRADAGVRRDVWSARRIVMMLRKKEQEFAREHAEKEEAWRQRYITKELARQASEKAAAEAAQAVKGAENAVETGADSSASEGVAGPAVTADSTMGDIESASGSPMMAEAAETSNDMESAGSPATAAPPAQRATRSKRKADEEVTTNGENDGQGQEPAKRRRRTTPTPQASKPTDGQLPVDYQSSTTKTADPLAATTSAPTTEPTVSAPAVPPSEKQAKHRPRAIPKSQVGKATKPTSDAKDSAGPSSTTEAQPARRTTRASSKRKADDAAGAADGENGGQAEVPAKRRRGRAATTRSRGARKPADSIPAIPESSTQAAAAADCEPSTQAAHALPADDPQSSTSGAAAAPAAATTNGPPPPAEDLPVRGTVDGFELIGPRPRPRFERGVDGTALLTIRYWHDDPALPAGSTRTTSPATHVWPAAFNQGKRKRDELTPATLDWHDPDHIGRLNQWVRAFLRAHGCPPVSRAWVRAELDALRASDEESFADEEGWMGQLECLPTDGDIAAMFNERFEGVRLTVLVGDGRTTTTTAPRPKRSEGEVRDVVGMYGLMPRLAALRERAAAAEREKEETKEETPLTMMKGEGESEDQE